MRVLVTGSRQFTDRAFLYAEMDKVGRIAQEAGDVELIVVHGAAPGADTLASEWCWDRRRFSPCPVPLAYPVNWRPMGVYNPHAGKARNVEMLRSGVDLILAFFANGAKNAGTRHCVTEAARWVPDIEVKEFWR